MRKLLFTAMIVLLVTAGYSQKKAKPKMIKSTAAVISEEAKIPSELYGTWMYGNFSTTEYWSTAPRIYLGNALTFAIAFRFKPDGTYEHYFTSSSVMGAWTVYHQSLTKGTYTVDATTNSITTTPSSSHYKRIKMGMTEEDRDMKPSEFSRPTTYTYKKGTEPNGTEAVYLVLEGTSSPLTFLKKQF